MCRTTDFHGFLPKDRNSLKIKAFFIRFSGLKSCKNMPDSLTLAYLPRINGAELLVDGSSVKSDAPAFLTLHRVVNVKTKGEAVYGSRERVRASGAVRFEVLLGDERILKGMYGKNKEDEWKLEWKCAVENEAVVVGGSTADVAVAVDGEVPILSGRVEMALSKRRGGFDRLEVIPEEKDEGHDRDESENSLDGEDDLEESYGPDCDMMMDSEGVTWAVDLGIWVMCLGVGYLVSKASAKSFRRLRLI
ncbi:uncharacterized protein LOC126676610 [Mercurialis annua]|uniref:uncharacterized protein LOC126676610 n=1 Tax=Mercurialis annua TaxID=3986 RepID=UPI00215EBD45|nr:uncharacterized protein LOC126676610 [Mercurialis annua]